ncbi:hypothetical protein ACQKJ1_28370 [Methylorubrum rhodesianum]|uniref:hypothetical protein n=1 Tax=Methylorubrum rhodesianum TaxID=29427 RepID=UPI003CFF7080
MKAVMKMSASVLAVALSLFASAAMADTRRGLPPRPLPPTTWDGFVTGSVGLPEFSGPATALGGCSRSSAQEGNANQQNFPVKQYGQTSGGYRC